MKNLILTAMGLLFFGCSSIPDGMEAVKDFDKTKYLGKWYEIARFDYSFERNLNNTTAEYSLNENGSIKVVNRGYNFKSNKWEEVTGKAKFVKDEKTAMLKVSFFGPFYGGYNVLALDKDYKYALVAGGSTNYLWILSRETSLPAEVKEEFLVKAKSLGFKTETLIWVKHGIN